jgi:uncharacterized protein (TIGR02453 family)
MATQFTEETMKFLRGLARNNDREWFEKRRDVYERALRAPMLALVEEINAAMEGPKLDGFAPEHVRTPQKTVLRIYRDIRFSKNKMPYKTHMSAWWSRRGMEKTSGGGYYLQISPKEVMVAAGVYMPEREQLLQIRTWMADHHVEYRKLLKTVKGKKLGLGDIDAHALTRMPKGFPADHPADELLRAKDWGVSVSLPAELALEPALSSEIVRRFKAAAPVVDALNGAILHRDEQAAETQLKTHWRPLF